jgi:hypothetical protein
MSKKSDLTPSSFLPPAVRQVSNNLKWSGIIGFWVQIILGVVSSVILLLASTGSPEQTTKGTGFGLFCAASGLIALALGIYFAFRYGMIAKMLQNPDPALRPKRSDTLQVIRFGLIVNLIGMLFTILGAQTIVGIVLAKSLSVPQATIATNPDRLVKSLDLLIVQANTNTIMAHFTGIVSSLWLLNRITK